MMLTQQLERQSQYERLLSTDVSVNDWAAVKMLMAEARRIERKTARNEYELQQTDMKWRHMLHQVSLALSEGLSPAAVRANIASKYPFHGLLTNSGFTKRRTEMQDVLLTLQSQNVLFVPDTLPASDTTSVSSDEQ
eukprot:TRINITY_DN5373_c0_g1_i1.p1 TRINITY_DN5373_c0_g1~~TRINITY_DN5373_c0_g1_i1.p1  ORF type:complete len:149 (+),score=26.68 TRINITY_DN5373_c0_g1_i1:41-448(+)